MRDRLLDYRGQVQQQHGELEENVERLRRSQEQLASAQRLAHVGSWRLDLATWELSGSDEFRSLFGFPQDGKSIRLQDILDVLHPKDREGLQSAIHACVSEGATVRLDCRIALEDAPERILHVQARLLLDAEESPSGLEGMVQDVTERKRSEDQIRYLAYHDNLTGLGNRMFCRERLEIQLTRARRTGNILGLLFLDLDRFKRINDTLGHSVGDELLKGVADRLVGSVRETDFIGRADDGTSIARLGGDEFTVCVTHPKDVQDLATVARRILDTLSRPFTLGGHEVVISGSIGITAYPHDGERGTSRLSSGTRMPRCTTRRSRVETTISSTPNR